MYISTAVGLRDRAFLEFSGATGARISGGDSLEQVDLNGTVRLFW